MNNTYTKTNSSKLDTHISIGTAILMFLGTLVFIASTLVGSIGVIYALGKEPVFVPLVVRMVVLCFAITAFFLSLWVGACVISLPKVFNEEYGSAPKGKYRTTKYASIRHFVTYLDEKKVKMKLGIGAILFVVIGFLLMRF